MIARMGSLGHGSASSSRTCVFCGKPANSREHIWPDWVRELFGVADPVTHERTSTDELNPPVSFDAPPFTLRVRRVCKPCNNEWMSDLEVAAKPYAERMIVGEPCELSDEAQRIIATWCFKTVAMFQFTHPANISIPASHYEHLYRERLPPPLTHVRLARVGILSADRQTVHVPSVSTYQHHSFDATLSGGLLADGYGATLSIGQLVFQVVGLHGEDAEDFVLRTPNEYFLTPIWPRRALCRWPPRFAFNEEALLHFGRAYLTA